MPGARKPHVAWPIIAFAATFVAAWLGAPGQAKARCALEGGPARAVTHVVDGETVKLDDGSEVRLAGIVAPRAPDSTDDTSFWPPAKEARSKLEEVVAGRSVELNFTATRTDRYGRQSAHVFTQRDGQRVWIQGALLSSGQARVFALAPATDCLDELMTHERIAFEARKGLWSNAAYQVRMAGDVHALMRYRNTLQLVEGVVSEVADVKGRVFLNFGDDWRTDFTAGIDKGRTTDWPKDFKSLKGERVRVRGFLERRNGPYIELSHPSQLEVLPREVQAAVEPERRRRSRRKPPADLQEPSASGR